MVRRRFVEKERKIRLLEDVDQLYCEVLGWCEKVGNMFCWLCFMMYFGPYLMYIVYWLNVGHAE